MLPSNEGMALAAVAFSSLDVTVTQQRASTASDGYGHSVDTWVTIGTVSCNVYAPRAAQLALYGSIIGSQWALMLRYNPANDLRQGDRIVYNGRNWLVQNIQNAESYTFTNDCLITVIV